MTERKPYVNPLVPTRAIDRRLAHTNVGMPDGDVTDMVRAAIMRQLEGPDGHRWTSAIQSQTVRYALWRHHRNLAEYVSVMAGTR